MSDYCVNCGSREYGGACTWCHEETYIAEQNASNDEPIAFSEEFREKLSDQAAEIKTRKAEKEAAKPPIPENDNPMVMGPPGGDPLKLYDLSRKNRMENGIG